MKRRNRTNSGVGFLCLPSIQGTTCLMSVLLFCYVGLCSYVVLKIVFQPWNCFPLKDGNIQQNSQNTYKELLCIKRSRNPK